MELQAFIIVSLAFMLLFGCAEAAPENAEGVAPPASGYFATIPQFMQGARS